jgi:hypothetical protein
MMRSPVLFPLLASLSLLGAGLFPAQAIAAGDPVAIVVVVSGPAFEILPGATDPRVVRLFDRLVEGSSLETGENGRISVAFLGGNRFELPGRSKARVGSESLEAQSGSIRPLAKVPSFARIAPIARAEATTGRSGAIRIRGGEAASIPRLLPGDDELVLAGTAVLRFRPTEPADRWKIEVEDEAGTILLSTETTRTELPLAADLLKPGATYFWRVRAVHGRRFDKWAEVIFETATPEQVSTRAPFAARAASDDGLAAVLLLAEIDRGLGLVSEACRDLTRALGRDSSLDSDLRERLDELGCP